ncbi:hypothetical protein H1C71_006981 [Ictidomys tridecemlineatus]|nr:hypothetical protein H1C71_006981 [Ictidomys tridecemlineatus]
MGAGILHKQKRSQVSCPGIQARCSRSGRRLARDAHGSPGKGGRDVPGNSPSMGRRCDSTSRAPVRTCDIPIPVGRCPGPSPWGESWGLLFSDWFFVLWNFPRPVLLAIKTDIIFKMPTISLEKGGSVTWRDLRT